MARHGGASGKFYITRKRRKRLKLDANKQKSRRAKLRHRRQDYGLF